MKKILISFAAISLFACNSEQAGTESAAETSESGAPIDLHGYTLSYSSSFTMGDNKLAGDILRAWRSWDSGDLSGLKGMFADSVVFYAADGSVVGGNSVDSYFATMQAYRDMFSSIKSEIHSVLPVKSIDHDQDWVSVWAREVRTTKDGKTDTVNLQETWGFNKDGKIEVVYQYTAQVPSANTVP